MASQPRLRIPRCVHRSAKCRGASIGPRNQEAGTLIAGLVADGGPPQPHRQCFVRPSRCGDRLTESAAATHAHFWTFTILSALNGQGTGYGCTPAHEERANPSVPVTVTLLLARSGRSNGPCSGQDHAARLGPP